MTREEANNIARGITDKIEATTDIDDWAEFWGFTRDDYEEFLEMPIKALEQEPCEDCISRAELINKTIKRNSIWIKITDSRGMNLQEIIDELPSIQPKPKTDVLDKIRIEIEQTSKDYEKFGDYRYVDGLWMALGIIDKHKAESEDKE